MRRRQAGSAGGAGAVLAAASLWGSAGTVAHYAPAAASAVSVGAARLVLAGAILALIALLSRGSGNASRPARRGTELRRLLSAAAGKRVVLAAGALSVAGYQLSFFAAVRLTGVAIGTVLAIGSAPVLAGLMSALTGGGTLTRRWLTATAAAIAGAVILVTGGSSAGVNPAGVLLALTAGLCYAGYAVTAARLITGGYARRAVLGVLFGGAGAVLLPVLLATSPGWLLTSRGSVVTAVLAVLPTVAAYLLYARGLLTVPAPAAVTLGLAEPVVATLLAVRVLGERLTGAAVAGLVLVCLALAVLVGRRPRSRDAPGDTGRGGWCSVARL